MQAFPMHLGHDRIVASIVAFFEFLRNIIWTFLMVPIQILISLMLFEIKTRDKPPTPIISWFPIIGSLPLFTKDSYLMLTRMAKKYGDIYQVKVGAKNLVVISDPQLLRGAFDMVQLSGRSAFSSMGITSRLSIFHAEGEVMGSQRNCLEDVLDRWGRQNFRVIADKVAVVIPQLLNDVADFNERPSAIESKLDIAITNLVFSAAVGTDFDSNDETIVRLITSIHQIYRNNGLITYGNCVPCCSWSSSARRLKTEVENWRTEFRSYMENIVADHQRHELDPENPRDFIDAFLLMTPENPGFDDAQLYAILEDIFAHSLVTISASVQWLLYLMVKHPDVQARVNNTMKKSVRLSGFPTIAKINLLPDLVAYILDGLRISTIHPIGMPHRVMQDTNIDGHNIPADSTVIGLYWKIHHDNELWDTPNQLNPMHHLVRESDQNVYVRAAENLMAFSSGTRDCQGEGLALNVIFVIFSSLLRRFRLEAGTANGPPSEIYCRYGILRETPPFRIIFRRRSTD